MRSKVKLSRRQLVYPRLSKEEVLQVTLGGSATMSRKQVQDNVLFIA